MKVVLPYLGFIAVAVLQAVLVRRFYLPMRVVAVKTVQG
jgi:hypothetical protein